MAPCISRAGLAVLVAALCLAPMGAARAADPVEYTEVYSAEWAILNSAPAMAYDEAVSREAALYNSEPPVVYAEAFGREAALYNSEPPLAYEQAFSREAVAYLSESPIVDAFSRESVVFNGYYVPEALEALRIAAGVKSATAGQMDRFRLAMQLASQNRISLPVAAAILRIAVRLQ